MWWLASACLRYTTLKSPTYHCGTYVPWTNIPLSLTSILAGHVIFNMACRPICHRHSWVQNVITGSLGSWSYINIANILIAKNFFQNDKWNFGSKWVIHQTKCRLWVKVLFKVSIFILYFKNKICLKIKNHSFKYDF